MASYNNEAIFKKNKRGGKNTKKRREMVQKEKERHEGLLKQEKEKEKIKNDLKNAKNEERKIRDENKNKPEPYKDFFESKVIQNEGNGEDDFM